MHVHSMAAITVQMHVHSMAAIIVQMHVHSMAAITPMARAPDISTTEHPADTATSPRSYHTVQNIKWHLLWLICFELSN